MVYQLLGVDIQSEGGSYVNNCLGYLKEERFSNGRIPILLLRLQIIYLYYVEEKIHKMYVIK